MQREESEVKVRAECGVQCKVMQSHRVQAAWNVESVQSQMGLSENRVYSQLLPFKNGIMISKTIGFRGLAYFQTHPNSV